MVQREVGERLCAAPRSTRVRRRHREGRVLGARPGSSASCRPACSSHGRTSSPRSPRSSARDTPADRRRSPDELFRLVRTAFGQRRKMLRRSLAEVVASATFDAAGIDATAPSGGARRRRVGPPDQRPLAAPPRPTSTEPSRRVAGAERPLRSTARGPDDGRAIRGVAVVEARPAKLTLSLRITGVRDDGYHLIDAEMVTLDLADRLSIDAGEVGAHRRRAVRRGRAARRRRTSSPGRCGSPAATRGGPPAQGDPARRWAGRRSADAAAVLRWAGFDRPRRRVAPRRRHPVLPRRRAGPGAGIGEIVEPLAPRALDITLVVPPLHVSTPAAYRAWDDLGGPTADGPNDLEPAALHAVPGAGRVARRASPEAAGRHADPRRQRCHVVPDRPPRATRRAPRGRDGRPHPDSGHRTG